MQNILFIVGINHDKAASRLIMVTQEPSLDSLTHGISFTSLRLALFGNSATRIAELDSVKIAAISPFKADRKQYERPSNWAS